MNTKEQKQKLLEELYAPYKNCQKCPLAITRPNNVAFGEGNPDAKIIFIGEAPGKEEDIQGIPFVGRSGKLLNKTLEKAEIDRNKIYITNIVKCRPPGNRLPTEAEANTCMSILLDKQIKIINPQIICTLGSCALNYIMQQSNKNKYKITKMHGKPIKKNELTIIPLLHPAYILRNPSKLEIFTKDMLLVKKTLENKKNIYIWISGG